MDCHRCIYLRYDGCSYGHCVHRGHQDVKFSLKEAESLRAEGRRPYNRQICRDFVMKKRCSNCKYWIRGSYFRDGATPAVKGRCSLRCKERGKDCELWRQGPTSWRKMAGDGPSGSSS